MNTLRAFAFLIVTSALAASANAQAPSESLLREKALRITDLEMRRQLSSATPATIDSLMALYSDSVTYEHPNAGAVIHGKALMRQGMLNYMGSARALRAEQPAVTIGHGVAIVETRARMEVNDGGKWMPVERHGIRVIEFDTNGLVRRLIDYPW